MNPATRILVSVVLMLPGAAASAAELDWMAGHWCGLRGKTFNEETWLPARGDLMIGMHRDTRDGRAVGFEFMRIARQQGTWTFLAQPGGGAVVAFPATTISGDSVTFANPQHDFPQRVTYRRVDADTLHARVDDGTASGQSLEWTWKRDCTVPAD